MNVALSEQPAARQLMAKAEQLRLTRNCDALLKLLNVDNLNDLGALEPVDPPEGEGGLDEAQIDWLDALYEAAGAAIGVWSSEGLPNMDFFAPAVTFEVWLDRIER